MSIVAFRPTRVRRYWRGKVPEWANALTHEEDSDDQEIIDVDKVNEQRRMMIRKRQLERQQQEEEILPIEEEEEEGDETEESEETENQMATEIMKPLFTPSWPQEEEILPIEDEEEEGDETEESEETESQMAIEIMKPLFTPSWQRDTSAYSERLEAEQRLQNYEKKRMEEKKVETKQMVVEKIREEKESCCMLELEAEALNLVDIDMDDEAKEYEAWKDREFARIKRDKEEREKLQKGRHMTEEEEEQQDCERKKPKQKQKQKFMQKYYHKGPFFQANSDVRTTATTGTDEIYRRDFSAPTGDDKMDKSILPRVMQVKRFGLKGRTKWTHLLKEDTTFI